MKKIVFVFAAILFFFTARNVCGGTVVVKITGIEEIKGKILLGLYNRKEGFADIGREFKGVGISVKSKTVKHTFTDIPPGEYAIAACHDTNLNGKHDRNFFGIPVEMYGFSGDARGFIGKPGFDDAKFTLEDTYTVKIKLK